MNIQLVEDGLAIAKKAMMEAAKELEAAHQESRFNMFEPLARRANTITSKIETLEHIIVDLKNVRFGNG